MAVSSSTPARARRAVAHEVASRVKSIDASRQHAAKMMELCIETTTGDDDARARRRRARVRERVARVAFVDGSDAFGRARVSFFISQHHSFIHSSD